VTEEKNALKILSSEMVPAEIRLFLKREPQWFFYKNPPVPPHVRSL
jgi:hypothetical protein